MAEQWASLGSRPGVQGYLHANRGMAMFLSRMYTGLVLNSLRHICVGNLTIIGSDNGLSPGWHQAINWTNAGILLIGRLGTNFNDILIQLLGFPFKKMRLKVSTAKWRLFCLGINVLKGRDYHLPFIHQHWFYSNGLRGANKQSLTFSSPWDVAVILKVHFSNS